MEISVFTGQLKSESVKNCGCLMPVEHLKCNALGDSRWFVLSTNSGSGTGPRATGHCSLWSIHWYTEETLPCEGAEALDRFPRAAASSLEVSKARLGGILNKESCGHPQPGCDHVAAKGARASRGVQWILCHFSNFLATSTFKVPCGQ